MKIIHTHRKCTKKSNGKLTKKIIVKQRVKNITDPNFKIMQDRSEITIEKW